MEENTRASDEEEIERAILMSMGNENTQHLSDKESSEQDDSQRQHLSDKESSEQDDSQRQHLSDKESSEHDEEVQTALWLSLKESNRETFNANQSVDNETDVIVLSENELLPLKQTNPTEDSGNDEWEELSPKNKHINRMTAHSDEWEEAQTAKP